VLCVRSLTWHMHPGISCLHDGPSNVVVSPSSALQQQPPRVCAVRAALPQGREVCVPSQGPGGHSRSGTGPTRARTLASQGEGAAAGAGRCRDPCSRGRSWPTDKRPARSCNQFTYGFCGMYGKSEHGERRRSQRTRAGGCKACSRMRGWLVRRE
jgi:hypothetical protein